MPAELDLTETAKTNRRLSVRRDFWLCTLCALLIAGCALGSPALTKPSGILNATPVWSYRTADSIVSTPGQGHSTIYVKTNRSLIALDAENGAEQWRAESRSDASLSLPPIVTGGTVVVPESGSVVAAFDAETGHLAWRTEPITVSGERPPRFDAMVPAPGLIIVARHDWSLTAYAVGTGAIVWQQRLSSRSIQYLAVAGNVVYLAMGDTLSAYDASTGVVARQNKFSGLLGPLTVSGSVLYVVDHMTPRILALDFGTGRVLWDKPSEDAQPFEINCIVAAAGRILIAERRVVAISEVGGKLDWISTLTGPLECPVVLGGNIYIRTRNSTLYAFDMITGTETGSLPVDSNTPMKAEPGRGPIVHGGLVILPARDNALIALRP